MEIKFRVFDEESKKIMILRMLADFSCNYVVRNIDTLMQYTGLKDKNGVEIYEGDILHFTSQSIAGYQKVIVEENLEVRFQDGAFTTKLELLGNGLRRRDMFVIGNIYESPELLK